MIVIGTFFGLYSGYQQALLTSINTLNLDFVTRVNSTAASAENVLQNFAAQIYNTHSVSKMRTYEKLSNAEMIEGIRILNDFTASSTVLDSIYVYNGKQDYIYSTMSSGAVSDAASAFKDPDAVRILKERTPNQRMIPIPRMSSVSASTANRRMISIMIFDIVSGHIPADNAMMLNISSDWFSELYFGEDREATAFIVDEHGQIIFSSPDAVARDCSAVLSHMTESSALDAANGNLIFRMPNGEKMLCFHARMPGRSWTYVRAVPYAKYLSGLSDMKNRVLTFFTAVFLIAAAASVIVSYRFISPFRYIQNKLSIHAPNASISNDPIAQLNALVRLSSDSTHIKNALRDMLRDEHLRGMLMGYDEPEESSVHPNDLLLAADRPITPVLISSVRVQQMLDLIRPLCPHSEGVILHGDHTVLLLQPEDASALDTICRKLKDLLPGRHVIAGWPVQSRQMLHTVYERLLEAHRLHFLFPDQPLRFISSNMALEDFSVACESDVERITDALKAGNPEAAMNAYEALISQLPGKTYKSVIFALTQLARSVLKLYHEHFPDAQPSYKAERAEYDAMLLSLSDAAELKTFFEHRFSAITEHVRRERRSRQSQTIDEVTQIIHDRFKDPMLNSQFLADSVEMSAAYLSRVFKQTLGVSIADYISQLRIEEAKRLLTQTDIKVMDLGEKLGVENMQYFFVRFKQATGLTPRQYRMQHRPGEQEIDI